MERKYSFLKEKYYELLIPTMLMVMSEKVCSVADVFLIGKFVGGQMLASLNLVTPVMFFTGIFYILFGQGGNLLALRAKADRDDDKSNFYFTISIFGIIIVSLIYILAIAFFSDSILHMFNTPAEIYDITKRYLFVIILFYPLNCFVVTLSYFVRSDGFPRLPFYAVLIANVVNIIFDIIFLEGFGMGIVGAAWASVVGYAISVIYISTYFFRKERSFKFISLAKFKIGQIFTSLKKILLNTPEVAGKIFFATQIAVLTYLCSTYYGAAGLVAFLVYDNSETLVYMALSGIMKTMSPIVTVFHKEMDYKAVEYIISKSIKQLLIICVPIAVILFVYPDFLVSMFNVSHPGHIELVRLSIRITAFGLIGRCVSYLLANYTQAIQENRIALGITLLEECLISIFGALLLTHWVGGIGIWVAILLSETIPVLFYVIVARYFKKTHEKGINRILMLQDSHLVNMTYIRENNKYSEEFSKQIETIFEKPAIVMQAIDDLARDIFEHNSKIYEIDITLRLIGEKAVILLIDNGELYNPFNNEEFMNSQNIKKLADINCKFDYASTLGFNKSYLKFNDDSNLLEMD